MTRIPFNAPPIAGREIEYIREVLGRREFSGNGIFTAKCQDWLRERLGVADAFLTNSCTTALEMAAILAELEPGDEVIMPSFTFVSTANAMVLRRAVPVFVDIRSDTMNIDETTGILIFGLSAVVILYFLGRYFTTGIGVDGFTSQIVSIWFLGGLITLILGVFGIYIANILSETKRRPYTIVRQVHRTHDAASAGSNVIRAPGTGQRHDTGTLR